MGDLFEAILGREARDVINRPGMPELKWVKVIEVGVRPLTEEVVGTGSLWLIKCVTPEGAEVWIGVDLFEPSATPWGLRGFKSRAAAVERQESLRIAARHGVVFSVVECVRKGKVNA
jgi:hypothetical protein